MNKHMIVSDNAEKYMVELIAGFSLEGAIRWLRHKFDTFDFSSRTILPLGDTKNEREYFAEIERLGYVTQLAGGKNDNVNRPMLVVAVRMKKDLSERTSRLVQFNLAKKLLKDVIEHGGHSLNGLPSQGLFFFYDENGYFRISFVSGEVENKRFKFNEAKRQSFFVDPAAQNNIVRRRLFPRFSTFADVKEAFSVEALTKEFYTNLFAWYQWAMDENTGITFPNNPSTQEDDRKQLSEAMIRMITRLMFVWFIRQKGIVPNALFQQDKLLEIIRDFQPESMEQDNYYRVILQNLFFATLNCQPDKRKYVKSFHGMSNEQGVKTCYRCQEELLDQKAFLELMKPVPFLNCALFDCLDRQEDRKHGIPELLLDGFSSKKQRQAHVPNGLFFDKKRGLIKLFDLYEFTVDENNADDSDVALDPELLGKVFENLLGAFNPETQETARKATGSFYTPREIVDYMVEESLKNYLKTKVPAADDARLADLFDRAKAAEGAPVLFDDNESKALLDALYNCKILDPACGSGAFPMGVLHCMVRLFGRLDPHNVVQREKLMERYRSDSAALASELSKEDRAERAEALEKQMREGQMFPDYARKLYLIENCIYGVDIQPIATQISKLRFFISLLCDQLRSSWNPEGENYGLLSLPNLEAKFVCANTLLALPKLSGGELALSAGNVAELRQKLQQNRHDIFNARTARTKAKYKERDREIREAIRMAVRRELTTPNQELIDFHEKAIADALKERELVAEPRIELHEERVGADLFSEGELQWVEMDVNAAKRAELDQRIARSRRIIKEEQNKVHQTGMTELDHLAAMVAGWDPYDQNACSGFFDPEWMFNVKNGFDIVIGNPPYISAPSMVKICPGQREAIIQSQRFETLYQKWDIYIPFLELGIRHLCSDRGICAMIVPYPLTNQLYAMRARQMLINDYNLLEIVDLNGTKVFESATVSNCIPFVQKCEPKGQVVISHISTAKTIYHVNIKTIDTLVQDKNTAVWNLTKEEHNVNRHSDMHVLGDFCYISKGMVLNSDEKTAQGEFIKKDLIADTQDMIHCRKYIEAKDISKYRIKRERWLEYNTPRCPDQLSRPTFRELYEREKILINKIGSIAGYYDQDNLLCDQTLRILILWKDLRGVTNKSIDKNISKFSNFSRSEMEMLSENVSIKYILGILNSKYTLLLLTNIRGKGNIDINPEYLRNIPIPSVPPEQQAPIIALVDKILDAKKENPQADTSALEAEIDKLVYQLYGLTEEEIAVVEAANAGKTEDAEPETVKKVPTKKTAAHKKIHRRSNDEYLE